MWLWAVWGKSSEKDGNEPQRRNSTWGTSSDTSVAAAGHGFSVNVFSDLLQSFFHLQQQLIIEYQASGRSSAPLSPSPVEVQLIEIIRCMTEQLIWGDHHNDETFFSLFCEENIIGTLVQLFDHPTSDFLKVQIFQTLNLLIQNTTQATSLYFLFSNNQINKLISSSRYMDFALRPMCYHYISNHHRPIPIEGRYNSSYQLSSPQLEQPSKSIELSSTNSNSKLNKSVGTPNKPSASGRLAFHRRISSLQPTSSSEVLSATTLMPSQVPIMSEEDYRDDLVSWFVSFLKSISLRLSPEILRFFYNEGAPDFPLYSEAARYIGHRDSMVRTHVRTITLNVFQVNEQSARDFVVRRSSFFTHLACYLREIWLAVAIKHAEISTCNPTDLHSLITAMNSATNEHEDFLMYLHDICNFEITEITELLYDRLLRFSILPVLCGSLLHSPLRPPSSPLGNTLTSDERSISDNITRNRRAQHEVSDPPARISQVSQVSTTLPETPHQISDDFDTPPSIKRSASLNFDDNDNNNNSVGTGEAQTQFETLENSYEVQNEVVTGEGTGTSNTDYSNAKPSRSEDNVLRLVSEANVTRRSNLASLRPELFGHHLSPKLALGLARQIFQMPDGWRPLQLILSIVLLSPYIPKWLFAFVTTSAPVDPPTYRLLYDRPKISVQKTRMSSHGQGEQQVFKRPRRRLRSRVQHQINSEYFNLLTPHLKRTLTYILRYQSFTNHNDPLETPTFKSSDGKASLYCHPSYEDSCSLITNPLRSVFLQLLQNGDGDDSTLIIVGTLLNLIVTSSCSTLVTSPSSTDKRSKSTSRHTISPIQSSVNLFQLFRLFPSAQKLHRTQPQQHSDVNWRKSVMSCKPMPINFCSDFYKRQIQMLLRSWLPEGELTKKAENESETHNHCFANGNHSQTVGKEQKESNNEDEPEDLSLELFWLLLSSLYRPAQLRITTLRSLSYCIVVILQYMGFHMLVKILESQRTHSCKYDNTESKDGINPVNGLLHNCVDLFRTIDMRLQQVQVLAGQELLNQIDASRLTAPETIILFWDEWRVNKVPFPPLELWALKSETLFITSSIQPYRALPRSNVTGSKFFNNRDILPTDSANEYNWVPVNELPQREQLKHYLQFFLIIRRIRLALREILHRLLQSLEDNQSSQISSQISDANTDPSQIPIPFSLSEFYGVKCLLEREVLEPSPLGLDWFQESHSHCANRCRLSSHALCCVCPLCHSIAADKPARTLQSLKTLFNRYVDQQFISQISTTEKQLDVKSASRVNMIDPTGITSFQEEISGDMNRFELSEKLNDNGEFISSQISGSLRFSSKRRNEFQSETTPKERSVPKFWRSLRNFLRQTPILDLRDSLFPESHLIKPWSLIDKNQLAETRVESTSYSSNATETRCSHSKPLDPTPLQNVNSAQILLEASSTEVLEDSLTHAMSQPFCSFSSASESDDSSFDATDDEWDAHRNQKSCKISSPPTNKRENAGSDTVFSSCLGTQLKLNLIRGRVIQYESNKPTSSVERYFAIHSELLLFLLPHTRFQYHSYVKELLPIFSILFCSTSRSDPTSLHIDFIAEGQPAALPSQFTLSLGDLPPLCHNFEGRVEAIISSQSTLGADGFNLQSPSTTCPSDGSSKTPTIGFCEQSKMNSLEQNLTLLSCTTHPVSDWPASVTRRLRLFRCTLSFDNSARALSIQKQIQGSFRCCSSRLLERLSQFLLNSEPCHF